MHACVSACVRAYLCVLEYMCGCGYAFVIVKVQSTSCQYAAYTCNE